MLQQRQGGLLQGGLLLIANNGFITPRAVAGAHASSSPRVLRASSAGVARALDSSEDGAGLRSDAGASPDEDDSLDEAAKDEREYVRRRLREELKREPTEQELDEWLRQHTEGY